MELPQPPLIQALLRPAAYRHPAPDLRLVETHISWVLLTGDYVYKIKKPLNLGFLDFSTLQKRHFYCEEELRLNRRLAPTLYLAVVAITGTPEAPWVEGTGPPIEYAVKMRQFREDGRFDRMLQRGALTARHVEQLAHTLSEFHDKAAVAGADDRYGEPDLVYEPVQQNFAQIDARGDPPTQATLQRLERWSRDTFETLRSTCAQRKAEGRVRECHGDAHLANVVWLEERAQLFDCLEFNDRLRWIDVMNELAFLVMDLDDRGRSDLARRARNVYLEHSGDYRGLELLRFYQVYRALVRAKVAHIRLAQERPNDPDQERARAEYLGYLRLAEGYTRATTPALVITHGLSGSGKTWLTQSLLEALDAVRVRSDVERKRLHGIAPQARSDSGIGRDLYSAEASRRTYAHLAQLSETIVRAGYRVIVDAAFLEREPRAALHALAQRLKVPFVILDLQAPPEVLRARLRRRAADAREVSEADTAVLEHQYATREPLTDIETRLALPVAADAGDVFPDVLARLRTRLASAPA